MTTHLCAAAGAAFADVPDLAEHLSRLGRDPPRAHAGAASRRATARPSRADPAMAVDPAQTQVMLPDQFQWKPGLPGAPSRSVETAPVFGATDTPGPYVVLVKWHPGYMSAPHTYVTDRLCFVLSGTWWVNSGGTFEPDATVPVPAGSFVGRVGHTPHYDGVKKGETAPAVMIDFKLVDPSRPPVREV